MRYSGTTANENCSVGDTRMLGEELSSEGGISASVSSYVLLKY